MKILVANCGSSSIKYQLFSMTAERVLARGLLERVGDPSARLHHSTDAGRHELDVYAPDHSSGMKIIFRILADPEKGVIKSIYEINGVGHRVVHGGEAMIDSCRVDNRVIAIVRGNFDLAPLHNPPNLAGIEAAMEVLPDVPHVAVFDTAFLSTLPKKAHRYAVPADWYEGHHVRKYGFHGASHKYVALRAAELLGKPADRTNLITCHLGNGCSMTAVAGGKAVDHSMGMTPLEGLIMGTRSGDVDPAVVLYMLGRGLSAQQVDAALNKSSGLLGLSGVSNDMRDLLALSHKDGDPRAADAALAVEMFVYRIVRYIGSYYAILPGLDAVVLTGGIGENSVPVRAMIVDQLARLGARLDEARNGQTVNGRAGQITADGSALGVWVIPTNEELMIARDTKRIIGSVVPRY
ncbi:MAG: acetate kinase [Planctomycetes bacterium]|nr:acetate kinase [Planctomycetota bacterium]